MSISMRELGERVVSDGRDAATLCAPRLRFASVNDLDSDGCLDWRALLMMTVAECDDLEVCVGTCDFVTVRTGADPFSPETLADHSDGASMIAPIFDGAWVRDVVQDQFGGMPISAVVVVLSAGLHDPFRGHALGAWMICEVAHRMLPCNNGLLVLAPAPPSEEPGSMRSLEMVEKLTQHWRDTLRVDPIEGYGGLMGQSTAYIHLGEVREMLRTRTEIEIAVSARALLTCHSP